MPSRNFKIINKYFLKNYQDMAYLFTKILIIDWHTEI